MSRVKVLSNHPLTMEQLGDRTLFFDARRKSDMNSDPQTKYGPGSNMVGFPLNLLWRKKILF